MKAIDFRLGNLVGYNHMVDGVLHQTDVVTGIEINGISLDSMDGCFVDLNTIGISIKPIPITKKWLAKVEFKKINPDDHHCGWFKKPYELKLHNMRYLILFNIQSGACILSYESNDTNELDRLLDVFQGFIGYKVEFIHQLQNIFSAIAGEELIFNSPQP